ncbi:tape measure protein [candidate division KSB1 bacterium]|nr:tape measure protein [Phycisphaerae bacterium]NIV92159.1 tape measure protein [candidate division KSB1 bacterium]
MANLGSLIATLGVKLGPLRSGFRKAEQSFQDYEKRAKGSIKRVSSAVFGLRSALIGLGGTLLVRQFVKTADALSLVEGRLKLVTNSAEELATVQTELLRIANDTRNAYQGTADLYARVGRVTRDLDVSQKDLLQTTKTINQALIVSGAAAQEASAALVQLSQGLASGTLRGDELRSVLEQTPRLARAIAEGLGVTIGQLRELGTQGELTADRVIKALLSQRDVIEQEFSKMPKTVGQSFVVLNNIVGSIIKRINDSTAATGVMISLIEDFGKVINATFTVVEKSFADIEKSGVAADMAITIRNKLGKALEYTALAVAAVSDAWLGLKEVWQVLKIAYATFAEYVNKGLEWIMKRINDLLAVFQKVIAGLHADFRAAGLDFLADQFQKSHLFVVRTRVALTGMTKQLRNNQYFWSGVKEEAKDTLGILAAQETNLQKTKKLIEAVKTEMENMDAAEAAIQKADEAAASVGEALNLLPDENAKALKKMEKQYEDWQNTVGDMFTDFWINTFEHTGDAFEKLKMDMLRTFTSMLAKMATEAIAKPIFIPYIQGAAQALGLNIPGIQSTSGMVPSALSKVSEMLGLKETLDLFGVGMDKLGIAKGAAGIGSFMNAPLYGQQMVNVPGAGMAAIPGTGVTPFGLLGAGVSGYNAYQSFQAEDYGRAVYQATTAAMWAIPGMQPIAALMSIGDLIGIDDLMSNLGEWIGDRFNDPATFRGKYGLQAGQNFNILTNPALAFGINSKLNYRIVLIPC